MIKTHYFLQLTILNFLLSASPLFFVELEWIIKELSLIPETGRKHQPNVWVLSLVYP